MEGYKMLLLGGSGEITEKKSRFIATIIPVTTEEDAVSHVLKMKKRYWDAAHNCSAYVIGDLNEIERCNDDGEPSKTAGRPMLDVLLSEGIHNVVAVVTRYFGGTLLGTGGLIRAYQEAVKEGLRHCIVSHKKYASIYSAVMDYNSLGRFNYYLEQVGLYNLETIYTDTVTVKVLVPCKMEPGFINKSQEISSGRIGICKEADTAYVEHEGKVVLINNLGFTDLKKK